MMQKLHIENITKTVEKENHFMSKRIYGEKIPVSVNAVKEFWNKRASMFEEKGINATICGNQNMETAQKETEYDWDHVIPQLAITKKSRVLDAGCGIGRFAKMIYPQCGFYCGVDYTEKMVQVTEQICREIKESNPESGLYSLHHMSVTEAVEKNPAFFGGPFDIYVMWSIGMYMNDEDLEHVFQLLPQLMQERSTILLQDSIGLEKRLTLNQFPSESLQSTYSAIYRTREEYLELCSPLFEAGFSVAKEEKIPDFGNSYADSERRYWIIKRG